MGPLGRSVGPPGGLLGALEGLLRPSWRLSIKGGGVLYVTPPSGATILVRGVAKMALPTAEIGRSNPSRNPPSRSRGGGRGRVNPSPKGKMGRWKRGSLRPPTPRGLVGLITGKPTKYVGFLGSVILRFRARRRGEAYMWWIACVHVQILSLHLRYGAWARAKVTFGKAAWTTCTCKFYVQN